MADIFDLPDNLSRKGLEKMAGVKYDQNEFFSAERKLCNDPATLSEAKRNWYMEGFKAGYFQCLGDYFLDKDKAERRPGMKLNTIQKRNKLNDVYRGEVIGRGGECHEYDIYRAEDDLETGEPIQVIRFQKGARNDPDAQHGVLDEDLLEIVRDRLICFQAGEFATRENACALHHIEEALMWLNMRIEDRAERMVLGTYNK